MIGPFNAEMISYIELLRRAWESTGTDHDEHAAL